MAKQVFINLPVSDLKKSMDFYTAIGFINNPQFTDETAACMVFSDEIFVMLLTHAKFREFCGQREIVNTHTTAAVINALSAESPDEVKDFLGRALAAGGKETNQLQDYGFMLQGSFADPDGHLWEVFHMDMSKMPAE